MVSSRSTTPRAVDADWSVSVVKARATKECTTSMAMIRATSWVLVGQPSSQSCFMMPGLIGERCFLRNNS